MIFGMLRSLIVLSCLSLKATLGVEDVYVNAQVPWHAAVLDTQGKLLAWYQPGKNLGYDKVLHLGWDFIEHKVPRDTRHGTGLKIYLINSVFSGHPLAANDSSGAEGYSLRSLPGGGWVLEIRHASSGEIGVKS